jgi:hypothetical protein
MRKKLNLDLVEYRFSIDLAEYITQSKRRGSGADVMVENLTPTGDGEGED